jgi:hypothetical protein
MANGYGFGSLSQHVIAGLRESLDQGAWAAIKTARFDRDDEAPPGLLDAPRPVAWKLQLQWPLGRLITALAPGASTDAQDQSWDRVQRRFAAKVNAAENEDDPSLVAAAKRVRGAMLLGDGTGQTQLPQDGEVSFGRMQLRLAKEDALAQDLATLGLDGVIGDVRKSTEALAKALGMTDGERRASSPSDRIRVAMSECVQALNDVTRSMDWHLAHLPEGEAHAQVTALRATLSQLLDQVRDEPAAKEPSTPVDPPRPS